MCTVMSKIFTKAVMFAADVYEGMCNAYMLATLTHTLIQSTDARARVRRDGGVGQV